MTNRQWLKNLSDEEIATKLTTENLCCICQFAKEDTCSAETIDDCRKGVIAWLQAEHKEDTND